MEKINIGSDKRPITPSKLSTPPNQPKPAHSPGHQPNRNIPVPLHNPDKGAPRVPGTGPKK